MDELWQAAMRWSRHKGFCHGDGDAYESILEASMQLNIPMNKKVYTPWREYIDYLHGNHKEEIEAELIKMRLKNGHD